MKGVILRHFLGKSLIEVGCGKGYFLEYLHQAGFDITGIDPAYEGDNPKVIKARFEASLGVSADCIVACAASVCDSVTNVSITSINPITTPRLV